jgi:UrcA family protein
MQTTKTRAFAFLGAVVAGASLVTAAHADLPKSRVSYADINVQSADGQKLLAKRIDHAVHKVCDLDGYDRAAISACHDTALNRAYADLQQRGVTLR